MELKRYSGVLIRCNDKVLLCKRSMNEESRPGEWSVPCGHQEKNENKLSCAIRELKEETDITLKPSDLHYIGGIKTMKNSVVKGIMSVFLYNSDEEIIPDLVGAKDGEEHEDYGYFGVDKIPTPLGDGLLEIINTVLFKK